MAYYAGLDVSLEQTSLCVVDEAGAVVLERRVASEPEAIAAALAGAAGSAGAGAARDRRADALAVARA